MARERIDPLHWGVGARLAVALAACALVWGAVFLALG